MKTAASMTNEELVNALNSIAGFETWIASVREEAIRRTVDEEEQLPGWRVSLTNTHEKWDDATKVWKICEREGLREDDFAPRALLSPTNMKDLFGTTNADVEKLKRYIKRNTQNLTIVTENDKRARHYTLEQLKAHKALLDLLE